MRRLTGRILFTVSIVLLPGGRVPAVEVRSIEPAVPEDDTIERNVSRKLDSRRDLVTYSLDVKVSEAVVILSGIAPNITTRLELEETAASVNGVQGVRNQIEIRKVHRNDLSLESEARRLVNLYPRFKEFDLEIRISGAKAMLTGSVPLARDRQKIEEVVGNVDGIQSILNRILLIPATVDTSITQRRLERLLGNKLIFGRIAFLKVEVQEGGRVILNGVVPEVADMRKAEEIAYGVPGVATVINELALVGERDEGD